MKNDKKDHGDIKSVKKSYFEALILSIILITLGYGSSCLINTYYPLGEDAIHFWQVVSYIPWAMVIGTRSWRHQSYGGKTKADKLDENLFKGLSYLGLLMFVTTSSLQ